MPTSIAPTATRFAIDLPADPAYLATLRMFVSAIARHYHGEEDVLEDIKVAVTEACSAFLRYEVAGESSLHVGVVASPGRLAFEITSPDLSIPESPDPAGSPTPRGIATTLGMDLIRSLFEESEVVTEGRSLVRFSVPLGR
jgi:anti-sigma regulatory factor (Ser/Thr protein kinase)